MTGRAHRAVAVLGVALALICWPVWWLAGMLVGWMDLGDLDIVVRVVAIFAFLTLVETLSGRFAGT